MSVFKAYLKVLMKNSTAIFVYILVFLLIAVLNSRSISNEYKNDLESKKISIGIINESDSVESEKLEKYLEENFNEKKVIKDTEKIRESIVSEYVLYVLKIKRNGDMDYYCNDKKVEMAVNEKISLFIRINGLLDKYKIKDIDKKISDILNSDIRVNYYSGISKHKAKLEEDIYSYYNFNLYVITFVLIYAAYQTQSKFKEKEIINRIKISSKKIKKFKRELYRSYFAFVFIIWLFFMILPVILYGYKNLIDFSVLKYTIASFFYIMPISALACLTSDLIKNDTQASILINSGCLLLSFFSGVFIPLKFLPEYLKKVSSFFPMYWGHKVNLAIASNNFYSNETVIALSIEVLMAVAFMMIYLILNREKTSS